MKNFSLQTFKLLKSVPLKTFYFHEISKVLIESKLEFNSGIKQRPYILRFETVGDRDLFTSLVADGRHLECDAAGELAETVLCGSDDTESCRDGLLRVRAITWNLGNAEPPSNLSLLFQGPNQEDSPDILVVGTQECAWRKEDGELNTRALLHGILESSAGTTYRTLCHVNHWDRTLTLLIKKNHVSRVSELEYGQENTGIAHIIGNKGAVVVKFKFYDTSFCFVDSHLAAQKTEDPNPSARNANVVEIIQNVKMGCKHVDILNQFHYLFWLGDLNYRIDLPFQDCLDTIERGDLESLKIHDQLFKEMAEGRVFRGFSEADISFAPTYRRERGLPLYSSEKKRTPSWCDRVLWKTMPGLVVEPQLYCSAMEIVTSDHLPVIFQGAVKVQGFSRKAITRALKQVRTVQPYENEEDQPLSDLAVVKRQPLLDISFTYLELVDIPAMDANGLADPYVKMLIPQFQEKIKTPVRKSTLQPMWTDIDIMPIRSLPVCPEELDFVPIIFRAMDWDSTSADDQIGCAYMSLGIYKDQIGREVSFDLELTRGGLYRGRIGGRLIIQLSN